MNEVSEMPKEGQFVAVWIYRGKIWSDTFRWKSGKLFKFENDQDEFFPVWTSEMKPWLNPDNKPRFFTA